MRKFTLVIAAFLLILMSFAACSNKEIAAINKYGKQQTNSMKNSTAKNPVKVSRDDLNKLFSGFDGCFVLYDRNKDQYTFINEQKAQKRVPPCSTFKIVNSLIGLETGVLTDENTTFKWDGTKYPVAEWNKDHTLATAVSNSVVWYFQDVASKIGNEKMQRYLNEINYGNNDISGGITQFWLQSSLQISPKEQIDILKRFYNYDLKFSRKNIDIVKKILVLSNKDGIVLSGKTGTGTKDNEQVNGWFVGYLERDNNVYFFAANIEGVKGASSSKAREISLSLLKEMNLL